MATINEEVLKRSDLVWMSPEEPVTTWEEFTGKLRWLIRKHEHYVDHDVTVLQQEVVIHTQKGWGARETRFEWRDVPTVTEGVDDE